MVCWNMLACSTLAALIRSRRATSRLFLGKSDPIMSKWWIDSTGVIGCAANRPIGFPRMSNCEMHKQIARSWRIDTNLTPPFVKTFNTPTICTGKNLSVTWWNPWFFVIGTPSSVIHAWTRSSLPNSSGYLETRSKWSTSEQSHIKKGMIKFSN